MIPEHATVSLSLLVSVFHPISLGSTHTRTFNKIHAKNEWIVNVDDAIFAFVLCMLSCCLWPLLLCCCFLCLQYTVTYTFTCVEVSLRCKTWLKIYHLPNIPWYWKWSENTLSQYIFDRSKLNINNMVKTKKKKKQPNHESTHWVYVTVLNGWRKHEGMREKQRMWVIVIVNWLTQKLWKSDYLRLYH